MAPIRSRSATPSQAIIDLLQNDPLGVKDTENPLGTRRRRPTVTRCSTSTGTSSARSRRAGQARRHATRTATRPGRRRCTSSSYTPGSGSYRFWMWNQPASTLAATVEKYLADAEAAQPNTTVALSTYSLVHGACEDPSAIEKRYQNWITQLAHGIGNFRVVLYLEEDSLIGDALPHTRPACRTRLQDELAYAVNVLSQDPHLLIYMDAGAPDGWLTASETARYLKRGRYRAGDGLLRQRDSLRLADHRHPLRPGDRAADRRQALHRPERRQRSRSAGAQRPQGQRQRGPV